MIYKFTIPEPLLGYRASAARAHAPEYSAFKDKVRTFANVAKVPLEWQAPIGHSPGPEVRIRITIYWKKQARIDGKNVYAAIEDGLLKQDRGVASGSWTRLQFQGIECAKVEIEVEPFKQHHRKSIDIID